ncbi:hypothetical protein L6D11_13990 [Staphylococcus aureus]|nr:hypothetical protein [Staphylococcus aureus]
MMSPYILAFFFYFMIVGGVYICVKLNYKSIQKNRKISTLKHQSVKTSQAGNHDVYYIGNMTTEHFILMLLQTNSLDYGGYSCDDLYNKRTQTNYDAYDLFDELWILFEAFDEILDCDYVENGFGVYRYKGLEVRYYAKKDDMKIEMADMTIRGTLAEMHAFRNNPLQNFTMLDPITASNKTEDYLNQI